MTSVPRSGKTPDPLLPSVLHLTRQQPGQYGWAIVGPTGGVITVRGSLAMGLTRWEARQTLGLLGLPYTEQA